MRRVAGVVLAGTSLALTSAGTAHAYVTKETQLGAPVHWGDAHVSFVVDDILSTTPWQVRGIEIRGEAEALSDVDPVRPGLSRELIRLHPTRIRSWGLLQRVPDSDRQ